MKTGLVQFVRKHKKFSVRILAGLLIASLAACGAPEALHLKTSQESLVTVVSVSGQVVKSGKPVSAGEPMSVGETIMVDEHGSAILKIKDRASIQLKNSGKLVIDEISDSIVIMLDYGSLMSVVSPVGKKFQLVTPAATVGVRGTAFYVEARGIDQTYVCLCEGTLQIKTESGVQEIHSDDRSHHHPVLIAPDKNGRTAVEPAEMLNHTNDDISALENVLRKK